jgi:hypothetical protein
LNNEKVPHEFASHKKIEIDYHMLIKSIFEALEEITIAIERVTFIEESPSRSWNLSMNSFMNHLNGDTRSIQFRPPMKKIQ